MSTIIPVNSILADNLRSGSEFTINLSKTIHNIKRITLIGISIPSGTNTNVIYYRITNLNTIKHVSYAGEDYDGVIPILNKNITGGILEIDDNNYESRTTHCSHLRNVNILSFKFYNYLGNPYIINGDKVKLPIVSITPSVSPTTFTVTGHTLLNGDLITITDVDNAINNNTINDTGHVVTVTGPNTFTIPIDSSGNSASQPKTGTLAPYTFGANSYIYINNNVRNPIASITGPVTTITTVLDHELTTGATCRIMGMDNGATESDNNLINRTHVVTVTGAKTFTVEPVLSAYPATAYKTNTPVYLLGSKGYIIIEKHNISFQLSIEHGVVDKDTKDKIYHYGGKTKKDILYNL